MPELPEPSPLSLLDALTEQPQSFSGLAAHLGLSLAQLEQQASELLELGVPLQNSAAGLAVASGTPTLRAMRAAGFAGAYRYLPQVGSTQNEVRAWADDPVQQAPTGAVVLAEQQLAGRGRRGRNWAGQRQPGSALLFSVLLRPDSLTEQPLTELALWPLTAGVALQEACLSVLPTGSGGLGLKWPNDLITPSGRKLAGILLEAEFRSGAAQRVVLGIGLNVTAAPELAGGVATCLADLLPAQTAFTFNRAELLAAVLSSLTNWLSASKNDILAAWRSASFTLGQDVRVQTSSGPVSGRALDLNDQGELLVRVGTGQILAIGAGDVELIGALR